MTDSNRSFNRARRMDAGKEVIMSVNGVTSYGVDYKAYENVSKTQKETSKQRKTETAEVTYSSKMSDSERAELVEKLKADSQRQIDSFKSMVQDMFRKQGLAVQNSDDMWKMLASGNFTVDQAAAEKAQAMISEDGYWGVNQTSDRIFEMAKALSGGDEEGMDEMLKAFEKGFRQATKAWGRALPDISQQTYDAVQEKFKAYKESLQTSAVEE